MKTVAITLFTFLLISCAPKSKTGDKLEFLPFEVTGAKEAMPAFHKGLLLLHNFEYPDAAEAFVEAQRIDPSFAMAYWGEAMTYNHPVWRDQDADAGRAVLKKFGETPELRIAKAMTSLEKDFLKAVEILYGEGSKPDRDQAYADFMSTVYKNYPKHHEVAAFYALSLLGIKEGWNKELNMLGAQIAESILKENPRHPGALHYLIHSDDHPEYARYALAAANDYGKVASYAGHALHMPSHIYLALGMWDEVVSANEVSWQSTVDRKKNKNLTNDALGYHGFWWLEYGYLQQGRYDSARRVFERQDGFTRELPSPRARVHFVYMKGHYFVETGDWKSKWANETVETQDLGLTIRSVSHFTEGMKSYYRKDPRALKREVEAMEREISDAGKLKLASDGIKICSVKPYTDTPSQKDLDLSNVMKLELYGLQAWLWNDVKGAEKWFQEATTAEDELGYFFGPPDILKPAHEMYGDFLLAINKPNEAMTQYEAVQVKAPKRLLSLKGELLAARQAGDTSKEAEIEKILTWMLKRADQAVIEKAVSGT